MPIRINLLAAEQAAEELRRRDPIKRAIFGGCALVVLMLGWIGITQMQVSAARGELRASTNRLAEIELSSRQVRGSRNSALDAESRITALDQYAANRFLWGTFLEALQGAAVRQIKLTEIITAQEHASAEATRFLLTNFTVAYTAPPPGWKFWASSKTTPPLAHATNMLASITNGPAFVTNTLPYTIKLTETSTNLKGGKVSISSEFSNVPWASEKTTIVIKGRDYGTPFGAAIDEFTQKLSAAPYFKARLSPAYGLRLTERPPQPRADPTDPVNPTALFVPFTIELELEKRVFTAK